ncbi:MAG: beta-phosphoglucomutase [Bacteroidales bacterium]|nr:MAG: beta-phosphoglucomutase [Bacteroidales bacterium]
MKITTCIFDLDGVIVDTAKYHYLAWKRLAKEKFKKDFSIRDNEQLKGVSRVESLNILLRIFEENVPENEKQILTDLKNKWYVEYISKITPEEILPGVLKFLEDVKRNKLYMALASASKNARLLLDRIGLTHLFDCIVDGTVVTRAKPHPEVFLKCAELLEVEPQSCVVFEDAIAGVEAAHAGKMYAIGVGDKHILHKAEMVISSFENIIVNDVLNLTKTNKNE